MISIAGFAIAFLGIALHCVLFRPGRFDDLFGKERRWRLLDGLRVLIYLLTLLLIPQKLSLVGVLRKLVYLLAALCFVVLAVTGFYRPLVLDEHISGYLMMVHATFAPVFAVCLAILAVMWAHNCRFDKNYWPLLQRLLRRQTRSDSVGQKYELTQKVSFWLIILLALPLILSIVSSMFDVFGTTGQEFLLQLHRWCGLVLALAAILHTYSMILIKARE